MNSCGIRALWLIFVGCGFQFPCSWFGCVFPCTFSLYSTYSAQSAGRCALLRGMSVISAVVVMVVCLVDDSVPSGGSSPLPD